MDPQNQYSRRVFSGSLRKRLNGFEWVYLAEWQETVKGSLALSGAFGGKKEKCQEIPGFLMDFADDANISGRTRRCLACSEWHLSQECHLHVHPIGQRTEIAWSIGTAELGPQAKKRDSVHSKKFAQLTHINSGPPRVPTRGRCFSFSMKYSDITRSIGSRKIVTMQPRPCPLVNCLALLYS